MRFSTSPIVTIIVASIFAAPSPAANTAAAPPSQPAAPDATIVSIPYKLLIQRAVGEATSDRPLVQPRPNPLAPLAPELVAAFKELTETQSGDSHYAVARRKYLDALEQYGDPSGTLPTFADDPNAVQVERYDRVLREPPKVLGLIGPETLLVQTTESGNARSGPAATTPRRLVVAPTTGPSVAARTPGTAATGQLQRLWAVTKDAAKPILASGDTITLKATEPGKPAPSATVQYFRVLATDGHCACLTLRLNEQPQRSRSECVATLDGTGQLHVVLLADERIPTLPDAWDFSLVNEIQVSDTGTVAAVVTAKPEKRGAWDRRYLLMATPEGNISLVAGPLRSVSDVQEKQQPPDARGRSRPPVRVPVTFAEVSVGHETARIESSREQDVDFHIVKWNIDGTLYFTVGQRNGPANAAWSYSASSGTAAALDQPMAPPQLDFEAKPGARGGFGARTASRIPLESVLVMKRNDSASTVAQFPLPAPEDFGDGRVFDVAGLAQFFTPKAIAGPAERVAFTATLRGRGAARFDPNRNATDTSKHPAGEYVLLESKQTGTSPQLVAEGAMAVPAPQHLGTHCVGSIVAMQYLPDGRLLFAGADDGPVIQPWKKPDLSVVASLWLWDGKESRRVIDQFTGVEAPLGSSRMVDRFSYDYYAESGMVLVKRAAGDCAFVVRLASHGN